MKADSRIKIAEEEKKVEGNEEAKEEGEDTGEEIAKELDEKLVIQEQEKLKEPLVSSLSLILQVLN